MKRKANDSGDFISEDESSSSLSDENEAKRSRSEEKEDPRILQDIQKGLLENTADLNNHISKQLFTTQKRYFTVYMEKLIKQIPMGSDLVNIVQSLGKENEFEYMFTAAKSIIQSQMKVKQTKACHTIFDMMYGLTFRYVHENLVSPALKSVATPQQLNSAYENYQKHANVEDGSELELQCLIYCIQEMLENQESIKVPNPLYSRITQQMKAMSEYVITILGSISKPKEYEMHHGVFDPEEK